jgi:hypothetical protein
MLVYIALALGKFPHPIATRALLGLQGVVIVGVSVAAALGLAAWLGLHITMIVTEVVPFLILAIGVDNIFILSKAFGRNWRGPAHAPAWRRRRQQPLLASADHCDDVAAAEVGLSVDEAAEAALREVGPTISAAACCEIMAFGVGVTTGVPALQQFCTVAAVAVAIGFVLQLTWFLPAVVLDARRQELRRADVLPCVRVRGGAVRRTRCDCSFGAAEREGEDGEGDEDGSSADQEADARDKGLTAGYAGDADADGEAPQKPQARACASWRTFNEGRFIRDGCMSRYAPARVVVAATWLALLGASLFGVQQLRLGLEQQLVLPAGSYLAPYFDAQSRLGEAGPPVYLVLQNVNYSHPDTAAAVADFAAAVGGLSRYIVAPVFSWVADFESWGTPDTAAYIKQHPELGCPTPLLPSEASFAQRVAQFVFDVPIESQCCQSAGFCGGQYSTDVKFLWGVPKANASEAQAPEAPEAWTVGADAGARAQGDLTSFSGGRPTSHVTKRGREIALARGEGPQFRSLTSGFDDGGCVVAADGSGAGYVAQRDLERALGARVASSRVRLPAAHVLVGDGAGSGNMSLVPCHVMVSRLRTQHTPLRNQSDFVAAMQRTQAAVQALQAGIPRVDLAALGISSWGPLGPGAALPGANASGEGDGAGASDNEHLSWLPPTDASSAAFAYSLFYVYYEQYSYLRGAVLNMLAAALAAVFATSLLVTGSLAVASVTCALVASLVLCLCGFVFLLNPPGVPDPFGAGPYGVDINAVSVVNLVTAAGLGVEFVIHVAAAFFQGGAGSHGDSKAVSETEAGAGPSCCCCGLLPRDACSTRSASAQRASAALRTAGASVVTGITLTKLTGVLVLAAAPSALFRLYYFRMYLGIVVVGAFHGLCLLPVLLATFG